MGFKQMVPVPEAETPVVSESAPARRPVLETATARLRDDRARGGHRARLVQGSAPRRRARHIAFAALAVVAVALAAACVNWLPAVYAWLSDPAAVRAFVAEHAVLARLAIVGVNVLQIVLAFLPGEPVELASGYALGFFEGTAACLAASANGTSIIYLAVRRWGHRVVDLFFDGVFRAVRLAAPHAPTRAHHARGVPHPRDAQGFSHLLRGVDGHAFRHRPRDRHVRPHPLDRHLDDSGVLVRVGGLRALGRCAGNRGAAH